MVNSNTKHSKELRQKTAARWNKENIVTLSLKFNKHKLEDKTILERFKQIEGSSHKNKLRFLLDFFSDNK